MEAATRAGESIYLSAISLVELTYLVEKGRLPQTALLALRAALNETDTSLQVAPVDLAIALTLAEIPRIDVPDMPDRIIAATALHLGLPLVTKDAKIRAANITTLW